MATGTHEQESTIIQTWPAGHGYEYTGDPAGPPEQRKLRAHHYGHTGKPEAWRDGQPDEWLSILHTVRAQMYQDNEVLCCDSMLVDELLKLEGDRDSLAEAFSYEEIRNLYPDPDSMDLDECHSWLEDHGHEVPSATQQTSCEHCELDIEGQIGGDEWRDRGNNSRCNDDKHAHEPTDVDSDQDEYLDELRTAIRDADPEPAEVFEWWRVTSWLCEQLHTIGEVTIDNGYGQWWGRCTTGQAYIMDGVLQQVAALFDD